MTSTYSNVTEDYTLSKPLKRKRKISSIACDNCRVSHLKCDSTEMCSNCKRKNLSCTYSKSKRRGRLPSGSVKGYKIETPKTLSRNSFDIEEHKINDNSQCSSPLYFNGNINIKTIQISAKLTYIKHMYPSLYVCKNQSEAYDHIIELIDLATKIYTKYTQFLFPFIQLPIESKEIFNHITVPIFECVRIDRVHFSGLNAILAIGFMLKKDYKCADEFEKIVQKVGKDIVFEISDLSTTCVFVLFGYVSLIFGNIERAKLYVNYSHSMCKSLSCKHSSIGDMVKFMYAILNKDKREKRFKELSLQQHSYVYSLMASLFSVIYRSDFPEESKIFEELDALDISISELINYQDKEAEYMFFFLMSRIARVYVLFKKNRRTLAKDCALYCLEYIEKYFDHIRYLPVFLLRILKKLYKIIYVLDRANSERLKVILKKMPYPVLIDQMFDDMA